MFTQKLNTLEGTLTVTIPDTVSLLQMEKLQDDLTNIETISVLSGISKEELYLVRNIDDFDIFIEPVEKLVNYLQEVHLTPKSVEINGRTIKVNQNISLEPVGAFMAVKNIVSDEMDKADDKNNFTPTIKTYSLILAHYLYEKATGLPYNEIKANEFAEETLKMDATKAIPLARCFFLLYPNFTTKKLNYLQLSRLLWKNRRELINLYRLG